jgi:organic hydroperoxide reductase OsmC/OhrA
MVHSPIASHNHFMIKAIIHWTNRDNTFASNRYSRAHTWQFDGGVHVPASASPDIVPTPMSDESAVDPEEAFVASISSCHMLWFLSIVSKAGFVVEDYRDEATGEMRRNERGKLFVADVTLRPRIRWSSAPEPNSIQIAQMHHQAHEECFIANSVVTDIRIE